MMIDARHLTPGTTLATDVCIIGSGAAGMSIAHELRHSGLDVLLLEAGGTRLSSVQADLRRDRSSPGELVHTGELCAG